MTGIFKAIAILLLAGGLIYFAAQAIGPAPKQARSVQPVQNIPTPLPAAEEGRQTLTGVIIRNADVTPSVPYIQYRFNEGVRTKQLILRDERGCSPSSGDLPCVQGRVEPYAELPYGENVRVTGVVIGDQIMVDSLEVL